MIIIRTLLWLVINFQYFTASTEVDSLCCGSTDYRSSNFLSCSNGKDYSAAPITSCATCVSYQCIDWTFGSSANAAREASFFAQTGEKVYFGVGSYSTENHSEGGLCYRIKAKNIDRDLIVQIVNMGGDVLNGNVDLQTGDGGFGLYNACTQESTKMPQFSGAATAWGATYGGVSTRAQCNNLPPYPICGSAPQDSMIDLCKLSFDKGLRNGNPVITAICQVACPSQLVAATGIHRSDEKNGLFVCKNNYEAAGGVITKTMDCTKPSYGWTNNVHGRTYAGYTAVIPCRRDGYTRINQTPSTGTRGPSLRSSAAPSSRKKTAPTCKPTARRSSSPSTAPTKTLSKRPTNRPTKSPSTRPTIPPSIRPTKSPSTRPTYSPSFRATRKPTVRPSPSRST